MIRIDRGWSESELSHAERVASSSNSRVSRKEDRVSEIDSVIRTGARYMHVLNEMLVAGIINKDGSMSMSYLFAIFENTFKYVMMILEQD